MVSVRGNESLRDELQRRYGEPRSVTPALNTDDFSSFIRLQRKQLRAKARQFYQEIPFDQLRNELVADYAEMLWYKCIGDIPQMFAHINFQVENMMNYYAHHTQAFEKVAANPDRYCLKIQKTGWITNCAKGFEAKGGETVKSLNSVGLNFKYAYWCIESGLPQKMVEDMNLNISTILQLRNYNEHRNTVETKPSTLNSIRYWENNCDSKFGYLIQILDRMKQSCVTVVPAVKNAAV